MEWDFLHPLKFQPSLILTQPQEKRLNLDTADYKSGIYLDPSPSTPKQSIGYTAFETGCKYHHGQRCWNSILSVLNKRMRGLDSSSSSVHVKLMLVAD